MGQIELTDTKIITNQTTFNDNELVTKKYVDDNDSGGSTIGSTSWVDGDNNGRIIHGSKSINFEDLIDVINALRTKKIVFTPSSTLTTNTSTHKISQWKDIPDLTTNNDYGYIAHSKIATKHELSTLTTTALTIRDYSGGGSQGGYSYKYQIRKNPNNSNVQFRYDFYSSLGDGVNGPSTVTLYLFIV